MNVSLIFCFYDILLLQDNRTGDRCYATPRLHMRSISYTQTGCTIISRKPGFKRDNTLFNIILGSLYSLSLKQI